MSAPSSEDRIRELVRDLRPVRPIPPLRSEAAVVAGTGLAVVCLAWRMGAFLPRARLDPAWLDARFLVILFGLALVAFGAISAALASAVPGRERSVRVGFRIGMLGIFLTLASGLFGVTRSAVELSPAAASAAAACLVTSWVLGFASCAVACVFIARSAMRRPNASAALAIAGSVALGAFVVHAYCPAGDALHQLVAHAAAPLIAVAVLTPLVSVVLRYGTRLDRLDGPRPKS